MKKKLSRQARIKILLVLDSVFFLVEIIIGYWLKSLSLVADSFHMLNDVMSLIVALYAIKLASRTKFSPKYSYGWQRAEVLGALVNGVFLLALCLTVLIEAIQRFFEYEEIRNPILILIVGGVGLFSNIIGILLFHEHNHSHNSSTPTEVGEDTIQPLDEIHVHPAATRHSVVLAAHASVQKQVDTIEEDNSSTIATNHDSNSKHHHKKNLNMHGVFLHVVGDALGNIGVIASALFISFTSFSWKHYADPVVSLFICIIIFLNALPLVRSASFILLQSVPPGIPLDDIRNWIKKLPGVYSVHDFHIWQLSDTKSIASIHILMSPSADYVKVTNRIKKQLHKYDIHSITIQPEFAKLDENAEKDKWVMKATNPGDVSQEELTANEMSDHESSCLFRCMEDDTCTQNRCCPLPSKES